jgi:hypothetical protein
MRQAFTRKQRMTALHGVLCGILILLVMQLWLLTATMNAHLGGDESVIWPAAVASAVCFALNAALLRFVNSMERPSK